MSETNAAVAIEEAATATETAVKQKKSGDLIHDTAAEIEHLTKTKALNEAQKLSENIEANSFRLGGVLKVIFDNAWFEGFESFGQFVFERFGFQERKARYLMEIYENLVNKQIPWEKVSGLGWTKLKDLARVLTPENVDEWVEKASKLTVAELQAVLKGDQGSEASKEVKTTDQVTVMKFKLHQDQLDTVSSALNKAKAETGTDHDTVALENICSGYLAGAVGVQTAGKTFQQYVEDMGLEGALNAISEMFPSANINVVM